MLLQLARRALRSGWVRLQRSDLGCMRACCVGVTCAGVICATNPGAVTYLRCRRPRTPSGRINLASRILDAGRPSRYIDAMDEAQTATQTLRTQLGSAIAANPLDALVAITSIRTVVADLERQAVRSSLDDHTWAQIGSALGVSKQAAFQRFGKQWVMEAKAEMKAAGGPLDKKALAEKIRRSLRSVK